MSFVIRKSVMFFPYAMRTPLFVPLAESSEQLNLSQRNSPWKRSRRDPSCPPRTCLMEDGTSTSRSAEPVMSDENENGAVLPCGAWDANAFIIVCGLPVALKGSSGIPLRS